MNERPPRMDVLNNCRNIGPMIGTKHSNPDSNRSNSATSRWNGELILAAIAATAALGVLGAAASQTFQSAQGLARIDTNMVRTVSPEGSQLREMVAVMRTALFRYQLTGDDSNRENFNLEARRFTARLAEAEAMWEKPLAPGLTKIQARWQEFLKSTDDWVPVKAIRRTTPDAVAAALDERLAPVTLVVDQLIQVQDRLIEELQQRRAQSLQVLQQGLRSCALALGALLASTVLVIRRVRISPPFAFADETEAVRQRQEKLASLGILATGVAHEIRNPLTAIKFRLFSLKKAYGHALADNEDFQTIRWEIDRLEKIVRSFLEFARPAEPNFGLISSKDLLEELRSLLEPEMSQRDIVIVVDTDEAVQFQGDRQQLQQVLINLTQNAADSMPGGGRITLRARSGVSHLTQKAQPVVLLEVVDTGPGIDTEIQKRLFDPFFSTKEGGTGLGLAIASRIVEKHGGVMQFSTRKDYGTTFTAVIPTEVQQNADANSPH